MVHLCSHSSLTKPELSKPSLDSWPNRRLKPAVSRCIRTLSQVKLWAAPLASCRTLGWERCRARLALSSRARLSPGGQGHLQQPWLWELAARSRLGSQPGAGNPWHPLHRGWALWGPLGTSGQKTKVVSIYREASSFGLEHLQKLLILEQFLFSILTHWLFAFLFSNTLHIFSRFHFFFLIFDFFPVGVPLPKVPFADLKTVKKTNTAFCVYIVKHI